MNSRAWTEVVTGFEARSTRRWHVRALLPAIVRSGLLLTGMLVGLAAYSELYWAVEPDPPRVYPGFRESPYEPAIRPSHEINKLMKYISSDDEPRRPNYH